MKKIILSIAAVVAFAFSAEAQTRKGTILLGAGSDLTNTAWTDLQITPKVGFFVQDGIAVGALVNFSNASRDFKTNPGDPIAAVTLDNSVMDLGLFTRYYVSNNLFAEIGLTSRSTTSERFDYLTDFRQQTNNGVPVFNPDGTPVIVENNVREVIEESTQSLDFDLGLGYTIVWREHFAVEPFVKLNFSNGTDKTYESNVINTTDLTDIANRYTVESQDVSSTDFSVGVNFSLFF